MACKTSLQSMTAQRSIAVVLVMICAVFLGASSHAVSNSHAVIVDIVSNMSTGYVLPSISPANSSISVLATTETANNHSSCEQTHSTLYPLRT